MFIPALLLVVASTLLWSTLDLLRKKLAERLPPRALLAMLTGGAVPLFALWVWWEGKWSLAPGYALPAALSIILNIISNLAFFESVRRSPLSVTIPLLSFTPVFTTLLAIPVLGELPRPSQFWGILLVVVGALLLNLPAGTVRPRDLVLSFVREPGCLLMLLVALLWAATISLDKVAAARSSSALHALLLTLGIFLAMLVILALKGELADLKTATRMPLTLGGALLVSASALGLQFVAMQTLLVSLIETIKRGLGNGMALLLGRLFFAEPITGRKLSAVALLAAGVAVVLLV